MDSVCCVIYFSLSNPVLTILMRIACPLVLGLTALRAGEIDGADDKNVIF